MAKKKKEEPKDDEESLSKLMKLTKMMKQEKVRVAPKGPPRPGNKWRSVAPKFVDKTEMPAKPSNLVQGGGMEVDPTLKDAYDNWRADKIAEQNERRAQSQRKAKAAAEARRRQAEEPPRY